MKDFLAIKYSDKLVNFLLQKLSNTQEKVKISALFVIRHLVNSSGKGISATSFDYC